MPAQLRVPGVAACAAPPAKAAVLGEPLGAVSAHDAAAVAGAADARVAAVAAVAAGAAVLAVAAVAVGRVAVAGVDAVSTVAG